MKVLIECDRCCGKGYRSEEHLSIAYTLMQRHAFAPNPISYIFNEDPEAYNKARQAFDERHPTNKDFEVYTERRVTCSNCEGKGYTKILSDGFIIGLTGHFNKEH